MTEKEPDTTAEDDTTDDDATSTRTPEDVRETVRRADEFDTMVESTETELTSVGDAQESASGDSDEIQGTIPQLMGIYEQVTDDVNPLKTDAHERMDSLIDHMLSTARTGQDVGERENVDLRELFTKCWDNVEAGSAQLKMDTSASIQADETRLQQMLEHLLRTAVQHAGPSVTIEVGDITDGFYIEDDGSGVPDEGGDDVFDQGNSALDEGNGTGLSVVRNIARAHGWQVRVSQRPAGGTRFEFRGVETTSRSPLADTPYTDE